jgi:ribosomal protein S12 methylthiotransferase
VNDSAKRQSFFITTLGCPKNLVDSERLAALLSRAGWRRKEAPASADLVIVNTCGFIADAQRESMEALVSACALKEMGAVRRVTAMGCLVQLEGKALCRQLPQLDLAVGVNDWPRLPRLLVCKGARAMRLHRSSPALGLTATPRHALHRAHLRYLKIAEGCDCGCGFCVIPRIRGPQRSMSYVELLREARGLLQRNAKELVVVAQDSTAYGSDVPGSAGLPALLRGLSETASGAGERWIRVLYLHPSKITDTLLRVMAQRPVLPYFDLALQHTSAKVLRSMRRPVPERGWEPLLESIRTLAPDAVLRATLLIGHPGETRSDFKQLLRFLEKVELDHVGAFLYSPQPGTPSAARAAPASEEAAARMATLDELLAEQAAQRVSRLIGTQTLVLVDGPSSDGAGVLARPWTDAPDIDWRYHLPVRARAGSFVEAVVVGGHPGSVELEPIHA